jgi:hypothetical protein
MQAAVPIRHPIRSGISTQQEVDMMVSRQQIALCLKIIAWMKFVSFKPEADSRLAFPSLVTHTNKVIHLIALRLI